MRSALLASLLAAPAAAAPPVLELPVACSIGEICFVQNYVDHDPGPGRVDHACGQLSYDGHNGTDIRVRDHVDMAKGYAVIAAAPGVVTAVRDGMPDISVNAIGVEAIRGREAGNGVIVDHGQGWETQYSHLRQGSVRVAVGDRVAAGDEVGLIGLSGFTEFPHVEFIIRKDGEPVDPFTGPDFGTGCDGPRTPLWSNGAAAVLAYRPTGLLIAGFADAAPNAPAVRRGAFRLGTEAADPDALAFWVDLFGAEAGDEQRFWIWSPDGTPFVERRDRLDAPKVSWFSFAGRRRPADGWPHGLWRARYELIRDGQPVVVHEAEIEIGSP